MREETIYDLLHNDHETVAALFEQMTATESAGQRERLLAQLKLELMAHSEAEDIVFYQPLKQVDEARGIVLEAAEEHRVVARLLGELERLSAENERWAARLTVLKELVEHHVEEEEGALFKAARGAFDRAQEREMGVEFTAEKKRIQSAMRAA